MNKTKVMRQQSEKSKQIQSDILDVIRENQQSNKLPLSVREIAVAVNVGDVYYHIKQMLREGILTNKPGVSRSLRVAE